MLRHCLQLLLLIGLLSAATTHAAAPPARSARQLSSSTIAVFSIVPAQAEPGTQVIMAISGVSDGLRLNLGGDDIAWRMVNTRHIAFDLPAMLAPGQYSLTVVSPDGSSRSYAFTVLPLKPVAFSIDPARITSCTRGDSRLVTIQGQNFSPSSQLLFDGTIIPSRYLSTERISFTAPAAARGGLHQIAVKNGDSSTTPLGLTLITAPDITSIAIGSDHVNSYELIISGDNFQQNSTLLVDGSRVETSGNLSGERLIFVDCTTLIYRRYPSTSTPKELRMQIVSPAGETSRTIIVTAP
jgi:hypothetical protein